MMVDQRHRVPQPAELGDDLGAVRWVPLHQRVFELAELRRLGQNRVRDAELADVVEQARVSDRIQFLALDPELACDREGDLLHALGMPGRVGVARVDRRVQGLHRLERILFEHRIGLAELSGSAGE